MFIPPRDELDDLVLTLEGLAPEVQGQAVADLMIKIDAFHDEIPDWTAWVAGRLNLRGDSYEAFRMAFAYGYFEYKDRKRVAAINAAMNRNKRR
jgi:hypothetical protein